MHQRTNELDIEYILVSISEECGNAKQLLAIILSIQAYSKDILRFRCNLIFLSYVYNKMFIGLDNEKHDGCHIRNRNFILLNTWVHPRFFGEVRAVHNFRLCFIYIDSKKTSPFYWVDNMSLIGISTGIQDSVRSN